MPARKPKPREPKQSFYQKALPAPVPVDPQDIIQDPFNRSYERSVINLISPDFQAAVFRAHAASPELFGHQEAELYKKLKWMDKTPTPTDNSLRLKFWFEYELAQSEGRSMRVKPIWSGVCDEAYFHASFLQKPQKVAWLLTKPASYEAYTEEALQTALTRIRNALDADPIGPTGKLDPKVAELQLKIFMALDMRVKGAVVQKTMNVHATIPSGQIDPSKANKEQLEERLRQLEELREKARGKIIDASPIGLNEGDSGGN